MRQMFSLGSVITVTVVGISTQMGGIHISSIDAVEAYKYIAYTGETRTARVRGQMETVYSAEEMGVVTEVMGTHLTSHPPKTGIGNSE